MGPFHFLKPNKGGEKKNLQTPPPTISPQLYAQLLRLHFRTFFLPLLSALRLQLQLTTLVSKNRVGDRFFIEPGRCEAS